MLKYVDVMIGLREIPDEISLCLNLSNCIFRCRNCHSSYLQENIGEPLTNEVLDELIKKNDGISCVCLMGGSNDIRSLNKLMAHCKREHPSLKRAVYLGNECFPTMLNLHLYDYVKLGSYKEKLGGLDSPNTNQRLKKITWINDEKFINPVINIEDLTYKFWK